VYFEHDPGVNQIILNGYLLANTQMKSTDNIRLTPYTAEVCFVPIITKSNVTVLNRLPSVYQVSTLMSLKNTDPGVILNSSSSRPLIELSSDLFHAAVTARLEAASP